MDDNLAAKFETITRTILSNQTDALNTLTSKVLMWKTKFKIIWEGKDSSSLTVTHHCQVEKDIGQVWRQMGIMYGQLSNSINILEKVFEFQIFYIQSIYEQVKHQTEEFSSKSNKNLGSMDNQVEGLTNRWEMRWLKK